MTPRSFLIDATADVLNPLHQFLCLLLAAQLPVSSCYTELLRAPSPPFKPLSASGFSKAEEANSGTPEGKIMPKVFNNKET